MQAKEKIENNFQDAHLMIFQAQLLIVNERIQHFSQCLDLKAGSKLSRVDEDAFLVSIDRLKLLNEKLDNLNCAKELDVLFKRAEPLFAEIFDQMKLLVSLLRAVENHLSDPKLSSLLSYEEKRMKLFKQLLKSSRSIVCKPEEIESIIEPLRNYATKPFSFWHHHNQEAKDLIVKIQAAKNLNEIDVLLTSQISHCLNKEESSILNNSGYYRALILAQSKLQQLSKAHQASFDKRK